MTKEFRESGVARKRSGILLQQVALIVVILLLVGMFGSLNPRFLSYVTVVNILRQISCNLLLATGLTFIIIMGAIDLSVGSILAMGGTVAAVVMLKYGMWTGILAGLGSGALAGIINAFVVLRLKVPPFIATLGMMSAGRGVAMLVTGGNLVLGLPEKFFFLGAGFLWGIPFPVVIAAVVLATAWLVLNKTEIGLNALAVGGNREAARLAGIDSERLLTSFYVITGILAALAGIILTSRLQSGQPGLGSGDEMNAIASVVIGGTSMSGGEGTIIGTIMGALLIGILSTGLNMLNVNWFWQQVIIGVVIVAAVAADQLRARQRH